MKKIIALFLVLLLTLAVGCNDKKPTSGKKDQTPSTSSVTYTSGENSSSEDTVSDNNSTTSEISKSSSTIDRSDTKNNDSSGTSSSTNGSKTTTPAEHITDRLKNGINLSGDLEGGAAKNYSSWMYDIHNYETIRAAGFDHVRITANPSYYMLSGAPDYTVDNEYLRLLDLAVNNAIDSGLIAVLDLFHGWTGNLISDFDANSIAFYKIWQQIAERYRDYPDTLMFELINEPNTITNGKLNKLQMKTVEIIRETNPTRVIALAANGNNGVWQMWNTEFPANDKNCIISLHIYDDMSFTHQGATWSGPGYEKQVRLTEAMKKQLTGELEKCKTYTERTGRKVWISEWGTYLEIADKGDVSDYTNYFTKECKRLGLANCYWEFMQGYGIYDMKAGQWKDFILDNFNFN